MAEKNPIYRARKVIVNKRQAKFQAIFNVARKNLIDDVKKVSHNLF
jgi:hypothetical protein